MTTSVRRRVLVVDDDPTVSEVVARYLESEGFSVERCNNGRDAVDRVVSDPPDLMILDLMLPGIDGFEVYRQVRTLAPVPVIMLTAKGSEIDRITGLDMGADDYVAKPFSPRELVSRVKAVLRRSGAAEVDDEAGPPTLEAGDISLDLVARAATVRGQDAGLTSRELELLAYFMRHPRQAFRREDLLEQVWGYTVGDTSTVTVHVRRLREKIEANPASPLHIMTVWGVGYRFEP